MPTTRPRHLLTETDELSEAIDAAAPLFPGATRAEILRGLIHLGAEAIAARQGRHRNAVRDRAGKYPDLYPATYLADLRDDWPE